jgi:hypothetical protein
LSFLTREAPPQTGINQCGKRNHGNQKDIRGELADAHPEHHPHEHDEEDRNDDRKDCPPGISFIEISPPATTGALHIRS